MNKCKALNTVHDGVTISNVSELPDSRGRREKVLLLLLLFYLNEEEY